MTKTNPFKIVNNILGAILAIVLFAAILSLLVIPVVALWPRLGGWALFGALLVPAWVGLVVIISLGIDKATDAWREASRKWDDKNRYKKF